MILTTIVIAYIAFGVGFWFGILIMSLMQMAHEESENTTGFL